MKYAFALSFLLLGFAEQDAPDPIDALFAKIDKHIPVPKKPAADPAEVAALLQTLNFEPYRGVMKGAEGTHVTGGGSSFDQAALAASLLAPKFKVRFSVGTISAEEARKRFENRRPGVKADKLDWKKIEEDKAAFLKTVDGTAEPLSKLLEGISIETRRPRLDTAWCWVEYEKDGQWLPLSEPPCKAEKTFEKIPDEYVHFIEVYTKLDSTEILRVRYPATELFGRPLVFRVVPVPGDSTFGRQVIRGDKLDTNPFAAIKAVKTFVPSVQLGRTGQYGKAFDLEGNTFTINAASGFSLEGAGNRVRDMLSRSKPTPPKALSWGVKRISPGAPAESWEREIFKTEDADRKVLSFLSRHDIYLDYGDLQAGAALVLWRRAIEPMRGFFKAARAYKKGEGSLENALLAFELEPQMFTAFAAMRTSIRREIESRFKARSFQTAPGVVAVTSDVTAVEENRMKLRETFDIMSLPSEIEGPDGGRFRFLMGVADTELELLSCDCLPPIYNTASMIRKAKPELKRLTKPEEADALAFKAPARERVKADLKRGMVVVAPGAEIDGEATWWRIDPRTGETLGIGETGCGQTSVEYWQEVHSRIKSHAALRDVMVCYLMAIWSNPIRMDMTAAEASDFAVLKGVLQCIPICSGLKKIFKFPESQDPYAAYGLDIEGALSYDANDLCKDAEKWFDKNVLGGK